MGIVVNAPARTRRPFTARQERARRETDAHRHRLCPRPVTFACGGAGGQSADFCQKAAACNALHYQSVDECIALVDSRLNNLLPAEAHDINTSMGKCMEMESCGNFVACAQAIK